MIFNYLNISVKDVKTKHKEMITHMNYMDFLVASKYGLFEKKFISKYYKNIIIDRDNFEITPNNYFYIDIDYKLDNSIDEFNIDEFNVIIHFTCWLVKLSRTYEHSFKIRPFSEDIQQYLLNIVKYVESIFVCKNCYSFCYKGNILSELCDQCLNDTDSNKYEKCECCYLNVKVDRRICRTRCDHYFHLDCIKNIKTYSNDGHVFMKCPKCNIRIFYVYLDDKPFHFEHNFDLCNHHGFDFSDMDEVNLNIKRKDKTNVGKDIANIPAFNKIYV